MQTQVWPVLRYLLWMAPTTAASRSASSKTMKGALPPSSSDTFFTVAAHWAISCLPTSVEPVKESLRTMGLVVSSPPMARGVAGDDVEDARPAGRPARPARPAPAPRTGVALAGLSTTVQPAARAGPALRVIMAAGKFHGVMAATTPIGSLSTRIRLSAWCCGMVSP